MYCGWENFYDPKRGIAEFRLSVFEECEDGRYERTDAVQREKYFSHTTVLRALKAAGLEFCGVFGGTDFSELSDTDERAYYFAKRPEEDQKEK